MTAKILRFTKILLLIFSPVFYAQQQQIYSCLEISPLFSNKNVNIKQLEIKIKYNNYEFEYETISKKYDCNGIVLISPHFRQNDHDCLEVSFSVC